MPSSRQLRIAGDHVSVLLTHVKVTRYKNGEYCLCCPHNVHVRPATEADEIRHYRAEVAAAAFYPNRYTSDEVRCLKDLLEGLAD